MDMPNIDLLPHSVSSAIDSAFSSAIMGPLLQLAKDGLNAETSSLLAANNQPDTIAGVIALSGDELETWLESVTTLSPTIRTDIVNVLTPILAAAQKYYATTPADV